MISDRLKIQLDRLDKMFPGQEVLYPEQIGQVLALSIKQQENLRARKLFPFTLRRIGKKVCADKLEVAEWLAGRSSPSEPSKDYKVNDLGPEISSRGRLGRAGRPGIGKALFLEVETSVLRQQFFSELERWWAKNT